MTTHHDFDRGDWARDLYPDAAEEPVPEDDRPLVLVLEATAERADEVVIDVMPEGQPDRTVASYNFDRWADAPVVQAVYNEDLITRLGGGYTGWTVSNVLEYWDDDWLTRPLEEGGIGGRVYSFPEPRLEHYGPSATPP